MKLFVYRAFGHFMVIAMALYVFQFFVDRSLRDSNDDSYVDWNRMYKGEASSDIVINGSSRAWVQMNPKVIENITELKVYNLGIDGYDFIAQMGKFKFYLKYNRKPKLVVQNVDLWSFSKRDNLYNKFQFLPYLSDSILYPYLSQYERNIRVETCLPVKYRGMSRFSWRALFSSAFGTPDIVNKYKGFAYQDKEWNNDFQSFIENKGVVKTPETSFEAGMGILSTLASECELLGIKLVLVHSPYYYKLKKYMPQQNMMVKRIEDFAKDRSIYFLNYENSDLCFDTLNFYNSTHLNKKGAEVFSKRLATDLKNILVKNEGEMIVGI